MSYFIDYNYHASNYTIYVCKILCRLVRQHLSLPRLLALSGSGPMKEESHNNSNISEFKMRFFLRQNDKNMIILLN